jgi:hypothetical protein
MTLSFHHYYEYYEYPKGLTADWIVLIADLVIGDTHYGPHPFVLRMRSGSTGELAYGIRCDDMGIKTVANDLDNARIA